MATYFPNSGNQRDVMSSLYPREADPAPYSDATSVQNNLVYVNFAPGSSYSQSLQNFGDLSIPNRIVAQESSQAGSEATQHNQAFLSGSAYGGVWRDGRNEMMFIQPAANMQNIGPEVNNTADSHMDIQNQLGTLHNGSSVSSVQGQGLSLSLSTQIPSAIPFQSFQFRPGTEISFSGSPKSSPDEREESNSHSKQLKNSDFSSYSDQGVKGHLLNNLPNSIIVKQMNPNNQGSYGLSALSSTIPNSKYLQAAQQLLEEVVNVRKALKQETEKHRNLISFGMDGSKEMDAGRSGSNLPISAGTASIPQEASSNSASDLSPAERQDLHNKLTKLLTMLDEVDQRYKQYYHQMQIVVSSFDVIVGPGAAQPYTALALQTISRHFRCLKDAINGQIRATQKNLGEQDGLNSKGTGGISRLRYVDQQLRQQRALQQIGMIQQHAWRPQRGLPESSVSILRAWLFEHFLHPYPKDSDKIMLARRTGLTRSQVSNWFINARVRLWKPMVEEMYKEEIGGTQMDSNSSTDNASKLGEEQRVSEDGDDPQSMKSTATEKSQTSSQINDPKSDHFADVEMPGSMSGFHQNATHGQNTYMNETDQRTTAPGFHQNINLQDLSCLTARDPKTADDGSLLQDTFVSPNGNPRFMATYQMSELGRFGTGGVSLTLGLQHCDGSVMPGHTGQQNLVTMRTDEMYSTETEAAGVPVSGDYDFLANRQRRFGSTHLLHDFVA